MIRGDPVLQAARAARVFAYVAAQGRDSLAGGVRCVEEPQGSKRVLELQVGHPGLNDGAAALGKNPEDAVQAGETDREAAVG